MTTNITIVGYEADCICEHCGRELTHGIRLADGRVVGATCLDKKLTKPKLKSDGRSYRLGETFIIKAAQVAQRVDPSKWSTFGVNAQTMSFVSQ